MLVSNNKLFYAMPHSAVFFYFILLPLRRLREMITQEPKAHGPFLVPVFNQKVSIFEFETQQQMI